MCQKTRVSKSTDCRSRVVNGLILFMSFSGLLVLGFSVNQILEFAKSGLPIGFYTLTSFAGLAWCIVFIFCLSLSRESKRNLLLLTFSTLVPIWAAELFLSISPKLIDGTSAILGSPTDSRSKVQVIHDLRSQGVSAYPNVGGSALL